MEDTSTQLHKMGKYSQCFCRHCSLTRTSNHQHVTIAQNPNDSTEYKQSGALSCARQLSRQDRTAQDETWVPVHNSTRACNECLDSCHGLQMNCGNFFCECRPSRTIHDPGKELISRGKGVKGKRVKSLAVQNRMAMGLLTRSTSCGDVCYSRCNENDINNDANSATDNEHSDVFIREDYSSNNTCFECKGQNILQRYRGIGSLPNLNGANKGNCKENTLGLEVMLSLINGPMQSIIDSKDEKIRTLERAVERLECENKQIKHEEKATDAAEILKLERTVENCVRQIEQLEEAKKTANETIRFLEDLRKNDNKYVDILKSQINELEMKLSKSDDRIREVEKEGKSQSERLKQQYEKRIEELQKSLRSKEWKLRDYDKIKLRVNKQKQELESKKYDENELHAKVCEQVLELKRELQLQETKLDVLEREKAALEESLSQSENLQRQDQKSSYVLQMKIVELQEKLEASYRKNEELDKQREESDARSQLLEDSLRQATKLQGKLASVGKSTKENQFSGSELNDNKIKKANGENGCTHQRRSEERSGSSGKCSSVFDLHVNDVLREKVVELHNKFYKGQQRLYEGAQVSNGEHIQNITCCEDESVQGKGRSKQDSHAQSKILSGNLTVSNMASRKMEMAFTGDKRRPSSDDSSSSSSSASSSRRGSSESPKVDRRQLKVLKVRKVSRENITQFQQNAAYITSLGRQQARKGVREEPYGSSETIKSKQ